VQLVRRGRGRAGEGVGYRSGAAPRGRHRAWEPPPTGGAWGPLLTRQLDTGRSCTPAAVDGPYTPARSAT